MEIPMGSEEGLEVHNSFISKGERMFSIFFCFTFLIKLIKNI